MSLDVLVNRGMARFSRLTPTASPLDLKWYPHPAMRQMKRGKQA
jgi:hypothetical protein